MSDSESPAVAGVVQLGAQKALTHVDYLASRDMPAAVAIAVLKVMTGIKRLEQTQQNASEGYKFASVDDFYEAVRPLLTDAGLLVMANEDSVDFRSNSRTVDGTRGAYQVQTSWLVVRYSFTLIAMHGEDVVTWRERSLRTIMVDASMGSQAFGAAESYAEKRYLRSLFKIATGDAEDVDTLPRGNLPAEQGIREEAESDFPGDWPADSQGPKQSAGQQQRSQRQGGNGRMSSAEAKRQGVWDKLGKSLKLQRTEEECQAWAKSNSNLIDSLPRNWQAALRDAYRDRMTEIDEKFRAGRNQGDPGEDDEAGPPPPIA